MKHIFYTIFSVILISVMFASCNSEETYAEQKEREVGVINDYLVNHNVKVIDEITFAANGYTTDVSQNEFVLISSSGVYMQIINKGCGEKIKDGESANILCRFKEYNLNGGDTLQLYNDGVYYLATIYDEMTVKNTSGTFTASFVTSPVKPAMYQAYQSTTVPSGWLVPLSYINIGRPQQKGDEIAKVQLLVPHTQGQAEATQNVYACRYIISYERGY